MKVVPFSLNMDKSTSTNTKRVFSILVCYYNRTKKRIAVEHLGSVDVPSCTSNNYYSETKKFFLCHALLWKKLIALLADSANTMQGEVSGIKTLIRTRDASHLLDIDGESCHHMHNVVKKVTSFFNYYLENLFRDISNEFKYCVDSLFILEEVTFHREKSSESQLLTMPVVCYLFMICLWNLMEDLMFIEYSFLHLKKLTYS